MTDHAAEAVRLAKQVEKTDPGTAALVHALLAIADGQAKAVPEPEWHEIRSYEDMPEDENQTYLFEYKDGRKIEWQYVILPSHAFYFRDPGRSDILKDPNDLVDDCLRWRDA